MKKLIKNHCIYLIPVLLVFFNFNTVFSQGDCGTDEYSGQAPYGNNFFGGYFKPERTDMSNGSPSQSTATFNMLFVFIQFQDENDSSSSEWLIGQPPTFMNKFLDSVKNGSGDFWNRYRDSSLSDYYQELSKGAFHVTGEARHLITYHTWDYYRLTSGVGYNGLLTEIYTRLKADTTIQWLKFDQWSRNDATDKYANLPDKYLDMMGLFFRDVIGDDFLIYSGAGGYVPLFGPDSFTVYSSGNDTVKIGRDWDKYGSGFVAKGNLGPLGFYRSLGVAIHEHGHYLFGPGLTFSGHSTSGIMTSNGGISLNDLFMSGFEKYKLGLLDTATVNYNTSSTYLIRDISGRNGSGQSPDFPQILRVPITTDDFFIIENRRKISEWDVYMLGDTTRLEPFRQTGDRGKGIYIYHSNNNGIEAASNIDIECADGLWNWSNFGNEWTDWGQLVNVKLRSSIPLTVNNDPGTLGFNNYTTADGISAGPWFSIGLKHTSIGLTGTDRIFTNSAQYWTSRERYGDRWDAWNIGYNEIFSPYSNPNTKSASNADSGIFVYYDTLINDLARLNIYKVDEPYSLDSILHLTPPSRPMGLTVLPCDSLPETNGYKRIKIRWVHNQDPDMVRTNFADTIPIYFKRYKIYRNSSGNLNTVPPDVAAYSENYYLHIATRDIQVGNIPEFTDTLVSICTEPPAYGQRWVPYPVRYRVQAVDKYDDASVLSDFANTQAWNTNGSTGGGEEEGRIFSSENSTIPDEFALRQNYPNPFNPVTNIQYDIPFDNFVSVKIYDVLGKEVATLVNELKSAGRYIISFSGSNYASGIYYYKIKAGNYEAIRKMILIK